MIQTRVMLAGVAAAVALAACSGGGSAPVDRNAPFPINPAEPKLAD